MANGGTLSNGIHDAIDKPAFQVGVKWHSDGFELIGALHSIDRYYAAGGKYILGMGYGSTRFLRQGHTLVIKRHVQPYYLAADPEGNLLSGPLQRAIRLALCV